MKHIVVDLEMNPISRAYSEERKKCKNEIIEIGAVILDDNYIEVGNFMTYVKPQLNDCIESKIVRLTNITYEKVENAPYFAEAFKMFIDFCKNVGSDIEICQWSDSDRYQIVKEIELKEYSMSETEKEYMGKWVDFQHEFGEQLGLGGQVSLKNALNYAGLDFKGAEHDALFDARNTAELLTIARVEEKRKLTLDKIAEVLHPTHLTTTLGSMLDFSQFKFD